MADPKHPTFELPEYTCPECGQHMLLGYYFFTGDGRHQHTHYVCMFWPSKEEGDALGWKKRINDQPDGWPSRCGWHGWTVPTPEAPEQDHMMDTARKIVNYVLEKAEVSVEKRQQINDFCDAYARQEIEDLFEEMQ
jgi:hypothetical protein